MRLMSMEIWLGMCGFALAIARHTVLIQNPMKRSIAIKSKVGMDASERTMSVDGIPEGLKPALLHGVTNILGVMENYEFWIISINSSNEMARPGK